LTLAFKERKNETVTVHKLLIVDDYEPFRRFICSKLKPDIRFQIIGQACDGLEAVQKAEELKPDLIVLDIGLPKLNGIEAARRLRELVPHAKILFLSQESSPDVVEETLRLGALGYVHKTRAGTELLSAVDTVLRGRQFVGSGLKGCEYSERKDAHSTFRHEVQFYSDEAVILESFTRFIAGALKAGNPALVLVTRSHGDSLLVRLRAEGVDVDAAIQQGTYISLDAADELSKIMVDGLPDPVRFFEGLGGLIKAASTAAKAEHPRVAFCGERVGLLWAEGKTDAAIRLEQFCNELAKTHEVDMLCAYPLCGFRGEEDERAFKRICAEHSAVHSR
jgi:DNA-binding NarL/FixJ family response regulator